MRACGSLTLAGPGSDLGHAAGEASKLQCLLVFVYGRGEQSDRGRGCAVNIRHNSSQTPKLFVNTCESIFGAARQVRLG